MSSNRVQEYELSWTSLLTQAPLRVIFLIFSNSESYECSCACSVQRGTLMVITPPLVTCHFVLLVSMMHYTTLLTSFLHHSMPMTRPSVSLPSMNLLSRRPLHLSDLVIESQYNQTALSRLGQLGNDCCRSCSKFPFTPSFQSA